ncbi:major facilitator superfamily transporter [Exophiala viscosa]|uniref:major facilitator superfamily transporter n=1 Tax=Exophiala viscosa TaxID=2486360 RepID=UPI0021900C21|nr:major facilitator superfamily transporter [Exophiala viscosa]
MAEVSGEIVPISNTQPAAAYAANDEKTTPAAQSFQTPTSRTSISLWRLVFSYTIISPAVLTHVYEGKGRDDDPFIVDYLLDDPVNPYNWPTWRRWMSVCIIGFGTLAVAVCTSSYLSALPQLQSQFHASEEVITLGLSFFILGFSVGPLLWGPLSEEYGRQPLYFGTYAMMAVFNIGATVSNSIGALIVLRFFAGAFGSSPLVVAGGVIADMFEPRLRGLGIAAWSACAFTGPAVGPIVAGFIAQFAGWRWTLGFVTIFAGSMWVIGTLTIPETYSPVILQRRARKLAKMTGRAHISVYEKKAGHRLSASKKARQVLFRPWSLLIHEPIVLMISLYMAILYATMFLLLGAFPVVFEEKRGWSQGISGLPFIGMVVGLVSGAIHMMFDNKRYLKAIQKPDNDVPEARLFPALIGAVTAPIGMFIFAWTNGPDIHWIVCIVGIAIYCHGSIVVQLASINYLIDSYTIFAASVLAINGLLRAVLAAAFPLFTTQMYHNIGIHLASSIPALLALACAPAPFIFRRYGKQIRLKCRYAAQAYEYGLIQRNAQRVGTEVEVKEPEP